MENLHETGFTQLLQTPVWKLCFLREELSQLLTHLARGYRGWASCCSSAEPWQLHNPFAHHEHEPSETRELAK